MNFKKANKTRNQYSSHLAESNSKPVWFWPMTAPSPLPGARTVLHAIGTLQFPHFFLVIVSLKNLCFQSLPRGLHLWHSLR